MDNEQYKQDLREAVATLRKGGIIVYPTDTVWGIGCDATNADAVARIFALKQRAEAKSMLVLVDSPSRAQIYVKEIPDVAYDMMELSDKPLTLILDGAKNLAPNLIAEDGSVGIRVTNEKFSHDLCYTFGKPVVSTSANVSGEPSAAIFAEISQTILDGADYVVKFRRTDTTKAKPSSIVKLKADGQVTIIRQ